MRSVDGGEALAQSEHGARRLRELGEMRTPIAIGAAIVAYVIAFVALEPSFGASTATLGLPLAAFSGTLLGARLGSVVAIAIFGLSLLLLGVAGYAAGDVVIRLGSGVGAILLIGVAAGFGHMRDLGRRTSQLLNKLALDDRQLRLIIGTAPIAICALDSRGLCTFAGGAPLDLLGPSRDRLAGRPYREFISAQDLQDGVRAALAGQRGRREIRIHGRVFDAQFAPMVDEAGERGMILVALDVTERAASVDALRRSEERAQVILETLPLIVLWVEPDGQISSSEGSGLAALGLQVGAFDGRSLFTIGSADPDEMRQAISGGRSSVVLRLTGREVVMRFVRMSGPATPGVLGVGVVIREQVAAAGPRPAALGELLIDRGAISRTQLEQALADQAAQAEAGGTRLFNELRDRLKEPH